MKRFFILSMLVLLVLPGKCQTVTACAMIRGGTPVTDGDPKDWPCGLQDGIRCPDGGCCGKFGECVTDDAGPYCQYVPPSDPSDPTMLARRTRGPRLH